MEDVCKHSIRLGGTIQRNLPCIPVGPIYRRGDGNVPVSGPHVVTGMCQRQSSFWIRESDAAMGRKGPGTDLSLTLIVDSSSALLLAGSC